MMDGVTAYPLCWPPGWRRAGYRTDAKFRKGQAGSAERVSLTEGLNRVYRELHAFGIPESRVVISSDLRPRLDGRPHQQQAWSDIDPGVAVYWQDGKQQRCMAIDRYSRLPDNLAAIAATLDAMRAIERHGGAQILDRAFTGFTALPAPEQWWQVLGVKMNATRAEIDDAYRHLAMLHHPDRGGSQGEMARINAARDQAYEANR